jgi:hypothetical protein
MPKCAVCQKVLIEGRTATMMPGIGWMHGICGRDMEVLGRAVMYETDVTGPHIIAAACSLLTHAKNEIAISMAAEWVVEWTKSQ